MIELRRTIDFGTLPQWISGAVLVFAWLTYRRTVLDKRREQAGKVGIVLQHADYRYTAKADSGTAHIRIVNDNGVPV